MWAQEVTGPPQETVLIDAAGHGELDLLVDEDTRATQYMDLWDDGDFWRT